MSRKETERTKLVQEKCATLLTQMLRDEDNKYCVDCDAKGPRWASWNLGVFLCIRCAGIHRNLGVHISRVKSVNLDSWTPEQVISLQQMGNSRARAVYEAQLPDGFRRPQTDTALESFIRAKYQHKKYLAREWVPPPPPKVDWAKEIDEELERQKRKKKAAQVGSALGLSTALSSSGGGEKKPSSLATAKSSPLPAPLPKPKPGQCGSSPKNQRAAAASAAAAANNASTHDQSNDLLGLASPTKPLAAASAGMNNDLNNDSFSGFLSAPAANSANSLSANGATSANTAESQQNSLLAKEEEDFFNQSSVTLTGKDQSGKLTKDSILALYGSAPPNAAVNPLASNHSHLNAGGQMPAAFGVQAFPPGPGSQAFAGGMGFMGVGGLGGSMVMPSQPQPQHHMHMQHQFMTPPNSTSMYNTPVMTAPNAFTSSGMHSAGGMGGTVDSTGFGANFPAMQVASGFPAQQMMSGGGGGGGIMSTGSGQPNAAALNMNLMQSQANMLGGMGMGLAAMGGGVMPMATNQFQPANAGNAAAAGTGNLNQQFGNLNIGNVWQ